MNAKELIDHLNAVGFSVSCEGSQLVIAPADKLTEELKQAIRKNKAAILAELENSTVTAIGVVTVTTLSPKHDPVLSLVKSKENQLAEAHNTIRELAEHNTALRDGIALERLPEAEIQGAYQTITELRAQVKTLEASLHAITSMRDSLMRENSEMKKRLLSQRNQIKKLDAKDSLIHATR